MVTGSRGTYTKADLVKRLRAFEDEYDLSSEEFFTKWEAGELPHTDDFFVWAGLCGYLGVKELESA
jgi:hypothetical protein